VAHTAIGQAWLADGNTAKARECFEETLKINPNNEVAHTAIGQAWLADGNTAKARECFEETLKINPNNEVARYMIAKSEYIRGNTSAARISLIQLISESVSYNPILLYLFAACTEEEDELWSVFEMQLGYKAVQRAKIVGSNYEALQQEERNYLYRNALWERPFSSEPVNKMAVKGVTF
jgi:Tfp pilus assembly protein PilF